MYVPGLGDHYDTGRSLALWFWRIYGLEVRLVPMRWDSKESYERKMKRVKDAIESAQKVGYSVSVIGESAGASMALNVAAVTPGLHRIITLAGVNSSDLPISPITQRRSPAFAESAAAISNSLKRIDASRVYTVRALSDKVVWTRYNDIPGARTHRVLSVGHLATIALCLTLYSPFIAALIRNDSRS